MLSIITPCSRQQNIPKLYDSIQFEKIDKWIIVYDTSKNRKYNKLYEGNSKIIEVEYNGGISGNPQRNYGMTLVEDGFIYFLDDDNIVHPNFWSILTNELNNDFFYTFNQRRDKGSKILYGNRIAIGNIDTAMFLIHKKHIKDIKWHNERYEADGYFIRDISNQNKNCHKYINIIGCYYNHLT